MGCTKHRAPSLPAPRGPLTEQLFAGLAGPPRPISLPDGGGDPLGDDDLHLALYCCYELHYRSFRDVSEEWEWAPGLLAERERMERAFEAALRDAVAVP